MKVLLDTHAFLWGLTRSESLSSVARRTIESSETFWSVASVWETLIKIQVGKLKLPSSAGNYLVSKMAENGVSILPIKLEHALRVEELEMHHRDPFDRILIAQSLEEGWPIITGDPLFRNYPVRIIW
jgi:PIN domain nuclease of toxin-antitoxin system